MGPQALSTYAQSKKECLKKSQQQRIQIQKAATTPTLGGWKREQGPWHRLGSWTTDLCQGISTLTWSPNPGAGLSHEGLVLSEWVILCPKTLDRELQSFSGREAKQSPTTDLPPKLTSFQPTSWTRWRAPANQPLPPRQAQESWQPQEAA